MKKRIIRAGVIVLCVLLGITALRAAWIYVGNYSCMKYYGKEYKQVIYPTSISDYITAQKVLKTADAALSTITTYENAYNQFGELGYLCVTDDDAVSQRHRLRLIAGHFAQDEGYMWVKYTSVAYDVDGEVTTGSWNILTKWELEKQDDRWIVTDINEAP